MKPSPYSFPPPTPVVAGFRMLPEWLPHAAMWLSWPSNPALWPGRFARIPPFFAQFASELSKFVPVRINAAGAQHREILRLLGDAGADVTMVQLFDHPVNDVWCRDHGPLFVKNPQTAEVAVTDWRFNAWGGKFSPYDLDDAIPARIAASLGLKRFACDVVLEGGALDVNSESQMLTTEIVLLNPNRNPGITKDDYDRLLAQGLGIRETLWLRNGLPNDDTDGHIDNLTRFINDHTLITLSPPDAEHDEAGHNLRENHLQIDEFRTTRGKPFDIFELPLPHPAVEADGRVLPASYVNYVLTNGAIFLPAFNRPTDAEAAKILHECYPDRKIVQLDCTDILLEGGALHCLTQHQPA